MISKFCKNQKKNSLQEFLREWHINLRQDYHVSLTSRLDKFEFWNHSIHLSHQSCQQTHLLSDNSSLVPCVTNRRDKLRLEPSGRTKPAPASGTWGSLGSTDGFRCGNKNPAGMYEESFGRMWTGGGRLARSQLEMTDQSVSCNYQNSAYWLSDRSY